jgi:hypothetical protein
VNDLSLPAHHLLQEGKKLTIDANEGTRVALAELDDNAEC